MVGKRGFEPLRLAAHDPKSCSSAYSDTPAWRSRLYRKQRGTAIHRCAYLSGLARSRVWERKRGSAYVIPSVADASRTHERLAITQPCRRALCAARNLSPVVAAGSSRPGGLCSIRPRGRDLHAEIPHFAHCSLARLLVARRSAVREALAALGMTNSKPLLPANPPTA